MADTVGKNAGQNGNATDSDAKSPKLYHRDRKQSTTSSCGCADQCRDDIWDHQRSPPSPEIEAVPIAHQQDLRASPEENNIPSKDVYISNRQGGDQEAAPDDHLLPMTVVVSTPQTNGDAVFTSGEDRKKHTVHEEETEEKKSLMQRFDAWVDRDVKYVPGISAVMAGVVFIICLVVIVCLALVITTSNEFNKKESPDSLAVARAALSAGFDQVTPDLWCVHEEDAQRSVAGTMRTCHIMATSGAQRWRLTSDNQVWLWQAGHRVRVHVVTSGRNRTALSLGGVTWPGPHESSIQLPEGAWVAAVPEPSDRWAAISIVTASDVIFQNSSQSQKEELHRIFPNYKDVTSKVL